MTTVLVDIDRYMLKEVVKLMFQAYDYGDSVENSKWENDSKGYSIMLVLFSTGIYRRNKKIS